MQKSWIKISSLGFFASYAITTLLGVVFPGQVGWFTQAFINFLGGAKGGIWTSEQIFWYVFTRNIIVVFIILVMGVLALSFTYPLSFGFFIGLTVGTWCYRHEVAFNPWTLVMVPWGVHGWIEATYMILASSFTMKIGIEMFGIKNRQDLLKHLFSLQRPISGWIQKIKLQVKKVFILSLCLIVPAVVFVAFFEAYITDLIFHWFYPA